MLSAEVNFINDTTLTLAISSETNHNSLSFFLYSLPSSDLRYTSPYLSVCLKKQRTEAFSCIMSSDILSDKHETHTGAPRTEKCTDVVFYHFPFPMSSELLGCFACSYKCSHQFSSKAMANSMICIFLCVGLYYLCEYCMNKKLFCS